MSRIFTQRPTTSPTTPLVFWFGLAVATLVLAGLLALALVVGRTPGISAWIDDPRWFRRALVVHVVMSLWGWFMAYGAGLRTLVDGPPPSGRRTIARVLAAGGVVAMVASAGIDGARPLLVNYVPVIDHPVFLTGLALFFVGAGLELCRLPDLAPPHRQSVPTASAIMWRATAPVTILAAIVFAISLATTSRDMAAEHYYETLFWGFGHTLLIVGVLAMLGAWFYLLRDRHGRAPVGPRTALFLATALVVPWLAAPFVTLSGTDTATYIGGFTRLMQFGIAGPVLVAIVLSLRNWRSTARHWAAKWAFGTSAALTVVGFILGAMIRGQDTMIPAHYHASLGAITVALMALTYLLLDIPGWRPDGRWWRRLAGLQPPVFGIGQLVFALGFAIGGLAGVDRKVYGTEQILDSPEAVAALTTMGVGGLMAVTGGIGFIVLIALACKRRLTSRSRS